LETFGPCGNSSQDQSRWLCSGYVSRVAIKIGLPIHSFQSRRWATPIRPFAHRPTVAHLLFMPFLFEFPRKSIYNVFIRFVSSSCDGGPPWSRTQDSVLRLLRYSSLSASQSLTPPSAYVFWQFSNIFAHMHVLQVIYLTACSPCSLFHMGVGFDVCLKREADKWKSHPWRNAVVFCQLGSCVLNPQQRRARAERPSLIKFYINRRAVQRHANNQRSPT